MLFDHTKCGQTSSEEFELELSYVTQKPIRTEIINNAINNIGRIMTKYRILIIDCWDLVLFSRSFFNVLFLIKIEIKIESINDIIIDIKNIIPKILNLSKFHIMINKIE